MNMDFNEYIGTVLQRIKVGDLVFHNGAKKPMKAIAVSSNYILVTAKWFGKHWYSVLEKNPVDHSRNNYSKGHYRAGTDNHLFCGYHPDLYRSPRWYLRSFERGEKELSRKTSVDITNLRIKSC